MNGAAILDRVPAAGDDQVGQRPDGMLGGRDDPAGQQTLMVGLFKQAVTHHQDDVRYLLQRRGLWMVMEDFLENGAISTLR